MREVLKQPLSEIEGYKSGTTVIHLNKRDLEEVRISVPAPDMLKQFEGVAEPLYQQRVACGSQVRALEALRDVLLPRLLLGELRVRDAEAVEEAV